MASHAANAGPGSSGPLRFRSGVLARSSGRLPGASAAAIILDEESEEGEQVPLAAPEARPAVAVLAAKAEGPAGAGAGAGGAVKAEAVAKQEAEDGAAGEGEEALAWAVLRPGEAETLAGSRLASRKRAGEEAPAGAAASKRAGERAVKRLRGLRHRPALGAESAPAIASGGAQAHGSGQAGGGSLHDRAVAFLAAALGGGAEAASVAAAAAAAFVEAHGASEARPRLLSLGAALRANGPLRTSVLAAGPAGAAKLATQDPADWATEKLQEKRRLWAAEALQEIKPAGPVGSCPVCGGRAVVACGTAGSGRSGRLTKAFAHYSCLEESCGRSTHVKQD
eukprot:TRINITY_DN41921_c0_g1_i1.p1 TRINITY_DN41921_c0_g1~~TRINITY_DN41921_c0_g1_i1.p1  ORF type:complete len:352 (+),score=100.67 TRINITY_DN41921_c0_g1_i1:43-1056(+)